MRPRRVIEIAAEEQCGDERRVATVAEFRREAG